MARFSSLFLSAHLALVHRNGAVNQLATFLGQLIQLLFGIRRPFHPKICESNRAAVCCLAKSCIVCASVKEIVLQSAVFRQQVFFMLRASSCNVSTPYANDFTRWKPCARCGCKEGEKCSFFFGVTVLAPRASSRRLCNRMPRVVQAGREGGQGCDLPVFCKSGTFLNLAVLNRLKRRLAALPLLAQLSELLQRRWALPQRLQALRSADRRNRPAVRR
jgi:hypothetical protein